MVDPNDPKDLDEVHKLQDAIKVSQRNTGKLELPNWDQVSLKEIREALLVLAKHADGFSHAFGTKDTVDPIKHLIATAAGWGGNPDKDATYVGGSVPKNDGKTVYKLRVKDVPVDAFWSVSVYNAAGYFEKNAYDAYSVNNITANKGSDGTVTIQFGDCDGKSPNCLPIMPGWNYTVRLYRPRPEILNGKWHFPEAQPHVRCWHETAVLCGPAMPSLNTRSRATSRRPFIVRSPRSLTASPGTKLLAIRRHLT